MRKGPTSCRSSVALTSKPRLLPWHGLARSSSAQRSTKPFDNRGAEQWQRNSITFATTIQEQPAASFERAGLSGRKLAKQVARRRESRRPAHGAIQVQDAHYQCSNQLRSRVQKHWPQHDTGDTTLGFLFRHGEAGVKELQADRRRLESNKQKQRFDHWKDNMQSANTKAVSRWLQHKEYPSIRVKLTMMTWRTTTSKQQLASTNIVRTFGSSLFHSIARLRLHAWRPTSTLADHKPQQKSTGNRQILPPSLRQSWMPWKPSSTCIIFPAVGIKLSRSQKFVLTRVAGPLPQHPSASELAHVVEVDKKGRLQSFG